MSGAEIAIAPGARAAEDWLIARLRELCEEARRNPEQLARPVRVVVNSRGLRQHIAARLAAELGALVGVQVQTLHGLACEVLRRAGESLQGDGAAFPLRVRRAAEGEAPLRKALADKRDGYGAVVQSVTDLLDAGLEAVHSDALFEKLAQFDGNLARRGEAVFRTALRVQEESEGAGRRHRSAMFRRAAEVLGEVHRGEALLPARAIFIHGYADATGVQADLLGALAARGAEVLIVHPPAPASGGGAGAEAPDPAGVAFTERLRLHLARPERAVATATGGGGEGGEGGGGGGAARCPELAMFRAPGAWAESREAACRAAQLCREGVAPERIAIVARDLAAHATPLRVHLRRLGVPFSGAPDARHMPKPDAWPLHALLDLLRDAEQSSADRWLDGSGWLPPLQRRDLRLLLHKLGRGRLRDVAALNCEAALRGRSALPLPVLQRAADPDEAEPLDASGSAGAKAANGATGGRRRRSVSAQTLRDAVQRARRACALFQSWPREQPFAAHRESLAQLCNALDWSKAAKKLAGDFEEQLGALEAELGPDFALDREGLVLLLEKSTAELGCDFLGGEGGGVQVLAVTEARGLVFDHLFLLGLNRGHFPRSFSEDPLLPDALRRKLLELLPDIPIKSRVPDEERYLFAQLLSAAPQVTLSWQEVSDDGKECNPSPLLAGLWSGAAADAETRAPLVAGVLDAAREDAPAAPRPAHEVAAICGAARRADRSAHAAALEIALREQAGESAPAAQAAALAQARSAALRELDPPLGDARRAQLGPFFGFTGAQPGEEVAVTRLEALARCPWQFFLERELNLTALPDVLAALPSVSPLDLGSLVHRILERMAEEAGVPAKGKLEDIPADAAGTEVPWPDAATLQRWLEEEAPKCGDGGLAALPGLAKLLIARAQQVLEVIRRCEWVADLRPGVLAVEAKGVATIQAGAAGGLRLYFRADRVERREQGLLLTDEKTGKPFWGEGKKQNPLIGKVLKEVEAGTHLQAAAYALSEGPGPRSGAYFYARPDWEGEGQGHRAIEISPQIIPELREKFDASAGALLRLHEIGARTPRLVDEQGDTPRRCEWCTVSEACSQFDTGARNRLGAWTQRAGGEAEAAQSGDGLHAAERALLAVLRPGRDAQ
ncbi:MAG: PD-(D/E)XK nuclease family protein [Deltaproteobacteria bacterium]|nr:PD-(D/E)XK nuclease family protein [Deltaproteobacteria bacterium]